VVSGVSLDTTLLLGLCVGDFLSIPKSVFRGGGRVTQVNCFRRRYAFLDSNLIFNSKAEVGG